MMEIVKRKRQGVLKKGGVEKSVCKMRKVLFIVECECISEDSKVRVYLSQVRQIRPPAVKDSSKKASMVIAKLALSAALTAPAAAWAVVYAFLERGYMAYGGECLFIVAAFMGVYWALGSFINDGGMDRL